MQKTRWKLVPLLPQNLSFRDLQPIGTQLRTQEPGDVWWQPRAGRAQEPGDSGEFLDNLHHVTHQQSPQE